MTIPDYQTLMLPVLKLASGGETRVPDVADQIADEFGLTQAEREQLLPSGRQRLLHNRVHWAKFYMTKAGLITSPRRGRFVASKAGRALLDRNPDRIDVETLLCIPAFAEFHKGEPRASTDDLSAISGSVMGAPTATTPEEQIEAAHSESGASTGPVAAYTTE